MKRRLHRKRQRTAPETPIFRSPLRMTDNRGVLTHQQPHMSSACVDDSTRHDTTIESVTMRSNNRLAILIDSFFDLTRQSDRREVEQFSDPNFDAAAF
jgi:hypothetical protein